MMTDYYWDGCLSALIWSFNPLTWDQLWSVSNPSSAQVLHHAAAEVKPLWCRHVIECLLTRVTLSMWRSCSSSLVPSICSHSSRNQRLFLLLPCWMLTELFHQSLPVASQIMKSEMAWNMRRAEVTNVSHDKLTASESVSSTDTNRDWRRWR